MSALRDLLVVPPGENSTAMAKLRARKLLCEVAIRSARRKTPVAVSAVAAPVLGKSRYPVPIAFDVGTYACKWVFSPAVAKIRSQIAVSC